MSERICISDGCDEQIGPRSRKGLCKRCSRRAHYVANREHELAGMARWRQENYEYDRARWAAYAEQRWGQERSERAQATAERLAAPMKTCSRCKETKPKTGFHTDPRRKDGRYSWCKACFGTHIIETRDPAVEAERHRRYYSIPENRERRREYDRRWKQENAETVRWYARNAVARRRARELENAVGEVDLGMVLERDGMVCAHLCGKEIESLSDLDFDHVVPLSRGGAHSMENIRPAHRSCNRRKHAKFLSELGWAVGLPEEAGAAR